jgi:hypothetical protein
MGGDIQSALNRPPKSAKRTLIHKESHFGGYWKKKETVWGDKNTYIIIE